MIPFTASLELLMRLMVYGMCLAVVGFWFIAARKVWWHWEEHKESSFKELITDPFIIVFGAATVLAPICIVVMVKYHDIDTPMQRLKERVILGLMFTIGVSLLLYRLRVKELRIYAVCEVSFATISCALSLYTMQDKIGGTHLIGLVGSIYLFVRGFDNYEKGKQKSFEKWEEEVMTEAGYERRREWRKKKRPVFRKKKPAI